MFRFCEGMDRTRIPYKSKRRPTISESNTEYVQQRTFSFGGAHTKYPRRVQRQMTRSGDSAMSYRSHRSLSRMFGRTLSTTLTLNSMDGSNSTILLEDWRPIFDKFDREIDGKQDGKIPLGKFIEILDEDPVWKESVPQPLKDKIISKV